MGLIELIKTFIDYVLHIDKYLYIIVQNYGAWVYGLLFLVIFVETGLVLTPFLPGDSLIFISGTLAASGILNMWVLFFVFVFAAILGDSANYYLGKKFGRKLFEKSRLFNEEQLHRTEQFYVKHGGKTIILARFIPIIRTFAPFVAGIGDMKYKKFISYNVVGALLWVPTFLFAGYFFGNIPLIKDNLIVVALIIIVVSFIPPVWHYVKYKLEKKAKNKDRDKGKAKKNKK